MRDVYCSITQGSIQACCVCYRSKGITEDRSSSCRLSVPSYLQYELHTLAANKQRNVSVVGPWIRSGPFQVLESWSSAVQHPHYACCPARTIESLAKLVLETFKAMANLEGLLGL